MKRKRHILTLLCAMMTFISAISVYGATSKYKLYDIDLTVALPDDLYIVTRDMAASDPVYKNIDSDALSFTADMEQKNIYLYALAKNKSYDISITAVKADKEKNFDQMTQEELKANLETEKREIEDTQKLIVNDMYISEVGDYSYYIYDLESADPNEKIYMLRSRMVFRNMSYIITLQTYNGELSDSLRKEFEDLYKSCDYTKLNASSKTIRMLNEARDLLIGTVLMLAILGVILIIARISRNNKKHHAF